jgi:Zn-dependent M28 family amino/carboxypeptidase
MKFIKYTAVIFLLIFSGGVFTLTNPVLLAGSTRSIVDVNKTQMQSDVNFLCGLTPSRNNEHVTSLDSSAQYILSELKRSGYEPVEQPYTANGKTYKNIICSFGPKDAERLIVGAHYDVCGEQQGADDNASGVAGLLEIARTLKKQNPVLSYRIDMVFYTLEEPPHFRESTMGSAIHAKYLHDNNIKVIGMICLEMIGYYSEEKHSQHYPAGFMKLFYPTQANFIAVVGKTGQGGFLRKIKRGIISSCGIDVRSINAPKFIPGIDFSDHLNYWNYGYEAVMITDTSFYRNDNYHQSSDVPSTLSFEKMAEVVKGVYNAVTGL